MNNSSRVIAGSVPVLAVIIGIWVSFVPCYSCSPNVVEELTTKRKPRLYWFIPDGMRADPDVFDVFRWAREGKLPNILRMMERGTYGFSRPTFPTHTPTNFATLFTGTYPEVHGVNDGPMHTEGNPLSRVSVGGFSALAKKVEAIWVTLEDSAPRKVVLLSVPGSTPPELQHGITIRGRWGGWGADFHAVNFQDPRDLSMKREQGRGARLFFFGPALTEYPPKSRSDEWTSRLASHSPALEVTMSAWGATVLAYLFDTTDDGATSYDRITFVSSSGDRLATLGAGDLSDWLPITLVQRIAAKDLTRDVPTQFRIKIIKLEKDGFFRVRFFYNNINRHLTDPDYIAEELIDGVGPMVDFVDNFPPQLIFFPEDKDAFLEEANASLEWHRDAVGFLIKKYDPDVLITDIYTPNQMLTSRWWMGYVDPASARYGDVDEAERAKLWSEVQWLYRKLDDIVGQMLDRADDNTFVVLSSDHGVVPLDRWVRLNNLFAREGLLSFEIDPATGEPRIDWAKTRAIYLKMQSVYIHPNGLAGDWKRGSGAKYEALRTRVKKLLLELEDEAGVRPVVKIAGWEDAEKEYRLLPERVGDLILANRPGYGWSEEMSADRAIFSLPLKTGYKQAILPEKVRGMWTPFLIIGPGVQQGRFIGNEPIEQVDQYPTIMKLLGEAIPNVVQGRVVHEALEPGRERP